MKIVLQSCHRNGALNSIGIILRLCLCVRFLHRKMILSLTGEREIFWREVGGGGSGARVYGGLAYDERHQRHTHHYHQQQLALRQSHSLSTTIDGVPNEATKKSINNFPCFIFLLSEHTGQQGAPYARACASANV